MLLPRRASRAELGLFTIAAMALSGGPQALYVKVFAYAPPLPGLAVILPVLMLMVANVALRLPQAIKGSLAALWWSLLAALAFISIQWSVSPSDTFRDTIVLLIAVPYLGMIAASADWRDIIGSLWAACAILLGLSLVLYVAAPGLGRMQEIYVGAFTGLWHEKNATGQFLCITALLSFARILTRPSRLALPLLVLTVCVVMAPLTNSATAIIATALGLAVAGWVWLVRRNVAIAIPALIATLIVAVPLVGVVMTSGDAILSVVGKSSTLTGRLPIWDALRSFAVEQRSTLGHGYGAYWSDAYSFGQREFIYDQLGFEAKHAHNSYLEMRLALGWAGTCLWLAAAAQAVVFTLMRMRTSNGVYFALPFAVAAIAIANVESSLADTTNLPGILFILILAKMTLPPSAVDRESTAQALMATYRYAPYGAPVPA